MEKTVVVYFNLDMAGYMVFESITQDKSYDGTNFKTYKFYLITAQLTFIRCMKLFTDCKNYGVLEWCLVVTFSITGCKPFEVSFNFSLA